MQVSVRYEARRGAWGELKLAQMTRHAALQLWFVFDCLNGIRVPSQGTNSQLYSTVTRAFFFKILIATRRIPTANTLRSRVL